MDKNKKAFMGIYVLLVVILTGIVTSAAEKVSRPEVTWAEHLDVVSVIIGTLFVIIAYFIVRTLRQIDRNQSVLFDKINSLSKEFYTLQGEHRALIGEHSNRHKEHLIQMGEGK